MLPQILSGDIDFWTLYEEGKLDLMTKRMIYPPKFTVTFGALQPAEEHNVNIHFEGCSRDLDEPVILPWPAISSMLSKSLPYIY